MFNNSWDKILKEEIEKPYFKMLCDFLREEYEKHAVFPPKAYVFEALLLTAYEDVKVVILGQDPYHERGQACGLAFAVPDGVPLPPSLKNIYRELSTDKAKEIPKTGNLKPWAEKGVLLLNSTLTVREGQAGSHRGKGWEKFTDAIISSLNRRKEALVFILWGNYAKEKIKLIDNPSHLILTGVHPSPLSASRGFFGKKYFTKAEAFLGEEIF